MLSKGLSSQSLVVLLLLLLLLELLPCPTPGPAMLYAVTAPTCPVLSPATLLSGENGRFRLLRPAHAGKGYAPFYGWNAVLDRAPVGTPYWMAPELVRGQHYDQKVGHYALATRSPVPATRGPVLTVLCCCQVDIWSLGIMLIVSGP
eukprot:2809061-Rhodomonas_salina.2